MTKKLVVLASGSPRRIDILTDLGLDFIIRASDEDEIVKEAVTPPDVVRELARAKADRVVFLLEQQPDEAEKARLAQADELIVLAADTIVVFDQKILGKPKDVPDACKMLASLAGNMHVVFTGVELVHLARQADKAGWRVIERMSDVDESRVYFDPLTTVEIESYVATGEPMDKAGSYAVHGIGSFMVAKIDGCHTNVIGLPVPKTIKMLRKAGIKVMGK